MVSATLVTSPDAITQASRLNKPGKRKERGTFMALIPKKERGKENRTKMGVGKGVKAAWGGTVEKKLHSHRVKGFYHHIQGGDMVKNLGKN